MNVETRYRAKCRDCDWWEITANSQGDCEQAAENHIEWYASDNSRPYLNHEVEITSYVLVSFFT